MTHPTNPDPPRCPECDAVLDREPTGRLDEHRWQCPECGWSADRDG